MFPFESVATATDSPRYSPCGSFRKFGTDVNGMSGTPGIVAFCCANTDPTMSTVLAAHARARNRFIDAAPSRIQPEADPASPIRDVRRLADIVGRSVYQQRRP